MLASGTGLYRIRGRTPGLLYVGEGRVRDRLMAHRKKLALASSQGHRLAAAAPLEYSLVLETRWLTHHRLELESDLIAAHTLALGAQPPAQFVG